MYESIEIYKINSETVCNLKTSSNSHSEQVIIASSEIIKNIVNKKVKFNKIKYIYLIPFYYEIIKSLDDIWWNENDFLNAYYDDIKKIKNLLNIHPSMTYKQAKKILYSPFSYDESNF